MKKQLLATVCSAAMLANVVPYQAFADDANPAQETARNITEEPTEQHPESEAQTDLEEVSDSAEESTEQQPEIDAQTDSEESESTAEESAAQQPEDEAQPDSEEAESATEESTEQEAEGEAQAASQEAVEVAEESAVQEMAADGQTEAYNYTMKVKAENSNGSTYIKAGDTVNVAVTISNAQWATAENKAALLGLKIDLKYNSKVFQANEGDEDLGSAFKNLKNPNPKKSDTVSYTYSTNYDIEGEVVLATECPNPVKVDSQWNVACADLQKDETVIATFVFTAKQDIPKDLEEHSAFSLLCEGEDNIDASFGDFGAQDSSKVFVKATAAVEDATNLIVDTKAPTITTTDTAIDGKYTYSPICFTITDEGSGLDSVNWKQPLPLWNEKTGNLYSYSLHYNTKDGSSLNASYMNFIRVPNMELSLISSSGYGYTDYLQLPVGGQIDAFIKGYGSIDEGFTFKAEEGDTFVSQNAIHAERNDWGGITIVAADGVTPGSYGYRLYATLQNGSYTVSATYGYIQITGNKKLRYTLTSDSTDSRTMSSDDSINLCGGDMVTIQPETSGVHCARLYSIRCK